MSLERLCPAHRFMYEYGCFAAFWSNFELLMEVAIWIHSGRPAKQNAWFVNPLAAGAKKEILEKHLADAGEGETLSALRAVFAVADRNGWIHGHILNPTGDFSVMTKLRIRRKGTALVVDKEQLSVVSSPFSSFYEAFEAFERCVGISKDKCDEYILRLQMPQVGPPSPS